MSFQDEGEIKSLELMQPIPPPPTSLQGGIWRGPRFHQVISVSVTGVRPDGLVDVAQIEVRELSTAGRILPGLSCADS